MNLLVEQEMSERLEALRQTSDKRAAQLCESDAMTQQRYIDGDDDAKDHFEKLIDPPKVRHAQQFFATFGLQIGAALVCKALPDSYAAARGAQVLYITGEFVADPARRVRWTTKFVLDVMAPRPQIVDGPGTSTTLSPGQSGAAAARRMRITHQNVRKTINDGFPDRWERRRAYFKEVAPEGPDLGAPLNQEDLIGTLHEFTVGVFESLNLLGVPYTDDDKAAWFHVWDVVACHMGIGTENAFDANARNQTAIAAPCKPFLRLDPKLSGDTLDVIRRRHHMESVEGTILVNALLAELERPLQRGMKPFPASLMRYLLGSETANLLGISRGGWAQQLLMSLNSVPRLAEMVGRRRKGSLVRLATSELSAMATQQLLHSFVEAGPRDDGTTFDVPPPFKNAWGLGKGPPRASSAAVAT